MVTIPCAINCDDGTSVETAGSQRSVLPIPSSPRPVEPSPAAVALAPAPATGPGLASDIFVTANGPMFEAELLAQYPEVSLPGLGLSMSHICPPVQYPVHFEHPDQEEIPDGGELIIAQGGRHTQLKARFHANRYHARAVRAPRGKCRGFSGNARRRCLQRLASIDAKKLGYCPKMITLTYPAEWPDDPTRWKRDLFAFCKRLERRYSRIILKPSKDGRSMIPTRVSNVAIIWKLEFQERGAPHFHLLVFTSEFIPTKWLAQVWYDIVGSGDMRHLLAGTKVEAIRSWRGVMWYASKYIAKKDARCDVRLPTGRCWGIRSEELLPILLVSYNVEPSQFWVLRRVLYRLLNLHSKRRIRPRGRHQGLSVFTPGEPLLQLLN